MTAILIAVVVVGAIYLVARNEPTPRAGKPRRADGGSDAGGDALGSSSDGGTDCGADGGGGCD